MTIVASNNITVSNVNDGTITHTAYAYSANGTDRFTTVYPNLNLLDGTADYSYGLKGENTVVLTGNDGYNGHAVIKTTISPSDSSSIDAWRYLVPNALEAGTYTLSFKAKSSIEGTNITSYFYSPNTTISSENSQGYKRTIDDGRSNFTLTTEWKTYWVTWKQSETASPKTVILARIVKGDVPIDVYITEPKFESGSIATPWMPSASEVTTADWPSYIGQYSDFTQDDSVNPSDYTWSLIRGSDGSDGVDGVDGVDGISPTVTVNPDTSLTIVDAQGTSTTPALKGTDGTSGIIVSSVAPDSPQTGQLWQDTSTTPQLVKKWTGSSWVIWELYAQNLKADTLQALSSNIGSIQNDFTLEDGTTGTLHIGNSEYRIDSQVLKSNFLFEEDIFFNPDGLNFNYKGDTASNSGYAKYTKAGAEFYVQSLDMSASYTVSGIRMSNESAGYSIKIHDANHKMSFVSENGQGFQFTGPVSIGRLNVSDGISLGSGQITAENVTLVPWTNLSYLSGYTTAEDNPCQYRKIRNLDGSYTVKFRGQVKPTSGNFVSGSTVYALTIPSVIMPNQNRFGAGITDATSNSTVRIGVIPSFGTMQIKTNGAATTYVSLDFMSYDL